MKTKTLLLSFFAFVLSISTFAQNPASSVNIPIQGIARDANNTARINTDVILTFEFYYLVSGTEFPIVSPIVQTLPTDPFGVFSTTLNLGGDKSYLMSNNQTHLRILEGTTIISNEPLNHVPYAVSANNGVPTGSIMPFMGATAPPGWLLCNGDPIPTGSDFAPLRDLLGNANTPNLQGLFLRGIGQYDANRVGPAALGDIQGDQNKGHKHKIDTYSQNDGSHSHTVSDLYLKLTAHNIGNGVSGGGAENDDIYQNTTRTTSSSPHTHRILGETNTHDANGTVTSGTESRPINYGVNYIIKL